MWVTTFNLATFWGGFWPPLRALVLGAPWSKRTANPFEWIEFLVFPTDHVHLKNGITSTQLFGRCFAALRFHASLTSAVCTLDFNPGIEPGTAPVTSKPTAAPSSRSPSLVGETFAPVPAPTAFVLTCAPTSSLITRDYCPCGYHAYGVRYNLGLGRITVVKSHKQCADRCTTFSGPQFAGGCKGFMTGMYMHMDFCRSYGSSRIATPCASWANPSNPGQYSGPLGQISSLTGQENVGGNCCSNITFVSNAAMQ